MTVDRRAPAVQWNPLDCRAFGLCAEEFPEGITLDEWGYPMVADGPVPTHLLRRARAAAAACPVLALRLVAVAAARPGRHPTGDGW